MDVVEPVSERAHMLAAEHQLGEAQAEYAEEMPGWLALAGFLFVGICIVSCAVFTISNPSSSSGGDDPGWLHGLNVFGRVINGVAILIVGASMLLGALFVIGVKLSRGRAYIYICERGFMRVTRRGTQLVRWSDIKELRLGIQRARGQAEDSGTRDIKYTPFYLVMPISGAPQSFSGTPGPIIERRATETLLPCAIERYDMGERLDFGMLSIDSEGLLLDPAYRPPLDVQRRMRLFNAVGPTQKLQGTSVTRSEWRLPWSRLALFWIDESRGTLVLSQEGEREHWAIIPLKQVSNVGVCLGVIEHALTKNERKSA